MQEISAVRSPADVEGLAIKKSPSWQLDADIFGLGVEALEPITAVRFLREIGRRRYETGQIKLKSRSRNFREVSGPKELSFFFFFSSFLIIVYFNWFPLLSFFLCFYA